MSAQALGPILMGTESDSPFLGRGIGNVAAHELGHSFGLEYVGMGHSVPGTVMDSHYSPGELIDTDLQWSDRDRKFLADRLKYLPWTSGYFAP